MSRKKDQDKIEIRKNVPNFGNTHALLEFSEWQDEDASTLSSALTTGEQLLGILSSYELRLLNHETIVSDKHGIVGTVKDGALITHDNGNPIIILNSENLGTNSFYAIYLGDQPEPLVSITTNRSEEIIISAGEEIYHLWDHLQGNIPTGTIDKTAGYPGKYDQKHEKDAALFRIKLLSTMSPLRWTEFQNIIDSKDKYEGQLKLHWEKLKSEK